jgi:outer membrane murein-binding lipoprotein Lpp
MDSDSVAILRSDIAALRNDVNGIRQDISILEAKADSIETWRVRYLAQEDQVISKLFAKVDELVSGLSDMRADIARIRGERDAERRTSMTIVSLLSAACGGLIASLFHG